MDKIQRKLEVIGDAIREKTGKDELLKLDEMPDEILSIETGIKTDDATAVAGDILSGKTAYVNDVKVTGTIPSRAAATITPGTSNQTIAAGTYLSGVQTITGDVDLVADNIKKGVNIFGVDGSYDAVELNFEVVGGTTQPSGASENTIWVNTDAEITSWTFIATEPGGPTEGMVWFAISTVSSGAFNALKNNGIQVYPISAKQYVDGTWVDVTAKSYQGGEWVEWFKMFAFNMNAAKWATISDKTFGSSISNNESGSLIIVSAHNTEVSNKYYGKYYSEPVDLTDYDKLVLDLKYTLHSGNAYCKIYFSTSPTGSGAAEFDTGFSSASGEKTITVSNLTGKYYLAIVLYSGYNGKSTLELKSATLIEVL